jgi:transglutaminase-like putative cysteine protease
MHLTVDHHTRYTFSEAQTRVVQLLRMSPVDDDAQMVLGWSIDVDCDARLREGRDGYGNRITMLYVDGPVTAVDLTVRGEVQTGPRGPLAGIAETLPSGFYRRTTGLTPDSAILDDFARSVIGSIADPARQAQLLSLAIFERMRLVRERTPKMRTAEDTLAQGYGNARDVTQLLIAAARAAGFPARFVSGHFLDAARAGNHKSAHCWVEVFVDGTGWLGFDPSNGGEPDDRYIRVAIGLDASDATPIAGTRRGGGIEALDVDVRVSLSGTRNQQ